jgi:hypothetical protein
VAGDPLGVTLLYAPHDPHPPQHAFYLLDELGVVEAFYGGAGGGGKALAINTPLPTPDGWTTMGVVQPGDEVLDDTGHACVVKAASEVMHGHVCYRLTMSDGASVVADAEHLWPASTEAERANAAKCTPRTTAQLAAHAGRSKLALRGTAPLQLPRAHDLLVDPRRYVAAVYRVPSIPVRCIQVDAPSCLFLAGRGMLVTHNSDALLTAALRYVDVPGYAALLLRKTYAELAKPNAIMDRAHSWLSGTDATWHATDHRWTFPSGATLSFGYLHTKHDRYQYNGAEYQFVGFDELTGFDEADYRYLFTRLRKPALVDECGVPLDLPEHVRRQREALSRVPLRMRSASNPGGRGHDWVKRRLVDRLPAQIAEGEEPDPMDTPERAARRVFIPARLRDNPSVDPTTYEEVLALADPYVRAQILEGDWDARPPGAWVYDHRHLAAVYAIGDELDEELARGQIAPPAGDLLAIGIDWGEHTHALIGWPLERGGLYVVAEAVIASGEPSDAAARIVGRRRAGRGADIDPEDDGPVVGVLDIVYELASRERPGGMASSLPPGREPLTLVSHHRYDAAGVQSMRTYIKAVRRRYPQARSTGVSFGAPAPRSGEAKNAKSYKAETIGHLRRIMRRAGEGKATGVLAIGRRCPELKRQLRILQWADREAGKVEKGDDHGPDALIALDAPNAIAHR